MNDENRIRMHALGLYDVDVSREVEINNPKDKTRVVISGDSPLTYPLGINASDWVDEMIKANR